MFSTITSDGNAKVISFAILTFVPLLSIGLTGMWVLQKLFSGVEPPSGANAVMGAGYALAVYLVVNAIV